MVNRETLSEHRSEYRLDALPATTVDFSGIRTHDSLCANHALTTKPRLLIEPSNIFTVVFRSHTSSWE